MPHWRSAQTARLKAPAASRPHFEELEPRVLYSADLAPTGLPGWAPSAEVRQLDTRLPDSADSIQASQQQQEVRLEIVFVDTRIDDYQRLLDNLTQQQDPHRELRVVLLDAEQDGIDTISRTLAEQPREVAAVHLISHGDPGHLQLGASRLDLNSVEARQEQLRSWALSLGSDADLLIYGCDVAATPDGQTLIERLAQLTGADVAASDDKTGNTEAGGDWLLEYRSGTVETSLAVSAYGIAGWNNVLATYVVTSTADSGANTLRQAIIDANANAGADSITFNIAGAGVHTITLASALPTITGTVNIDATTDDSFATNGNAPAIVIDASSISGSNVLRLSSTADGSTLRGLVIWNYNNIGIQIDAGSDGNTIAGNYIGRVGTDGNYNAGSGSGSYALLVNGANNVIGGMAAADRNVMANSNYNVFINGASTTGNQIIGNYLGVNAAGTAALTGSGTGIADWSSAGGSVINSNVIATSDFAIYLFSTHGDTVTSNLIGVRPDGTGTLGGASHGIYMDNGDNHVVTGNWIGNASRGIYAFSNSDGNTFQGNRIGTDLAGTANWGASLEGIYLSGSNNLIGGTGVGEGNIIAFSNKGGGTGDGVTLSSGTGNAILGNSIYGTLLGGGGLGIDLGASGVTANDAGDGDAGANNLQNFPVLSWASSNGADTVTIAGSLNSTANSYFRIEFFANPTADASGYGEGQIYLGYANVATDGSGNASFTTALSATVPVGYVVSATATKSNAAYNSFTDTSEFAQSKTLLTDAEGVVVVTTASDTLDGDTTSLSTLLANKGADGFISLREAITAANNTANGATPDQINFNIAGAGTHTITLAYDGPDPGNATDLLPSITDAVIIDATTDDSFAANGNKPAIALNGGGTLSNGLTLGAVSDGSTVRGLLMSGFTTSAISLSSNGNLVAGNYIGALTATGAIGGTGNYNGINISGNNNTIGGTTPADRNVISGNSNRGISFEGSTPTGNRVIGNYIGTVDATGAVGTPATVAGIVVAAGNNTQIGGTGAGEGNLVAGLSGYGVSVISGTGHAVLGNSIYSNTVLGLNLGANGVTDNDSGDGDTGANNLQNFPVLTVATTNGSNQVTVAGTLNSTANSYFRIEFFANPTADSSGYGEGQIYLGHVDVAIDGSGDASFSTTLSAAVPVGYAISATATKSDAGYTTFTDTSEFARSIIAISETQGQLVVDTINDTADGDTTSLSTLLANRGADGFISLREAITAANNTANGTQADRISFAIAGTGVHTITLTSALPSLTDAVILDASTDDSFAANGNRPAILLDGNGGNFNGLMLASTADGSTIRGLVIQNFHGAGILIETGSDGHIIAGNFIGSLNPDGITTGTGNSGNGLLVFGANNQIGGVAPIDRNVISGNLGDGIEVNGSPGSGNQIIGNYIGSDASGLVALGNSIYGIHIDNGAAGNILSQNIIVANGQDGVQIFGESSDGNQLYGNWIGLGADGTTLLGNAYSGIAIAGGSDNNVIGAPGQGNIIANSGHSGIYIHGLASGNLIQGNHIGTDASLSADFGVGGNGIELVSGAFNNVIGGTASGEGNVIAHSNGSNGTNSGIRLATAGTGNSVLGNRIFDTQGSGQGIDLGAYGPTENDLGDPDSGANNLQNFPVLTLATTDGSNITVAGTFNSTASSYFRIELFANPSADSSGYGEGQIYLGHVNVATDGSGDASFSTTLSAAVPVGYAISATATQSDAGYSTFTDTSEFSFTISASAANAAPAITSNGGGPTAAINVAENTTSVTTVTATDADLPSQTLSYSITGGADQAQFSIDANTGELTFNAAPNFELPGDVGGNNAYEVTVQVSDGNGGTDTQTLTVTVTNVNEAPTVTNAIPNQNATEDAAFSFQFAANTFNDVDAGDTLTYTTSALPAWLSFNSVTRTFSGTPTNADVGTVSIDVTADDGHGGTVTDTFDIVIANSNDAPTVANPIPNQNATEDVAFSFQFAANTFNDVDVGDTLTYSAQLNGGGALPAWLSFDALTRTFSGTPTNADVGTVSIDVTADDGHGGTVTDTFDIVIANSNDAPTVANPIPNQNATEDAAFSFQFAANTFNDVDAGDTLTYTTSALPAWLSFNSVTRTFSGTPTNADVGTVSIDVTADDGHGGTVTDTFNIVIANSNDAPTVANPIPNQNATEDVAFSFQFAANTFDDPDVSDTLTYTAQIAGGGALPIWLNFDAATRTFSGTPANADVGTVSIDVTANDGHGGTVTDTFDIVIANSNDAPTVANAIPDQNATENTPFNFTFQINTFHDQDVGDTLTYSAQLAGGGALPAWLNFDGATRTFSGTPSNADVGTITLDVTADDGNGGTVTDTFSITVGNTNDAPYVATPIPNQNATEDAAFNFQFAANTFADPDVDDTLTYSTSVLPAWLSFNDATRTFSGTPANGDVGTISITVTATDGTGQTINDTFDLVVANTNDAPTVANAIPNQTATENAAFNFTFAVNTFNDSDVGDTLTYTAQLAGGGALPAWLSFDSATRTFSGTPLNAHVGTVSIDVIANDGNGGTVTDSFNITVGNTNDAPFVANPITNQNATEDTAFNFQFAANTFDDPDVSDTLTYTAQIAGGGALPIWLNFDAATRTFSGTPANADVGTVSIDVTANDGHGGTVTDTFDIVIANSNDAPTVANAIPNQNATEDAAFSFQFAANTFNDVDVGDTLTYSVSALPAWLSFDALTRTFSGTPANADVGTVSIDVTANDGHGGTVTDTFSITVSNTNDSPTLANPIPNQNATANAAFNFTLAANTFNDVDVGDTLTYSVSALPAWLNFDANTRTFSGTPGNADVGSVSITVTASDGASQTSSDTFDIVVGNTANNAPNLANSISDQNAAENNSFNFTFPSNTFADPDIGDTLTYSASGLPAWLSFDANSRTFSGTPGNADVGSASITVTASDNSGLTASDTFNLVVGNLNDAPTATPVTLATMAEDSGPRLITQAELLSQASDADGDTLIASDLSIVSGGGSLIDNLNGTWSYTPAANDDSSVTFGYRISDGAETISTSASLDLTPVNDSPAGLPIISGNASESQTLSVLTGNISDADGLGAFSYQWRANGVDISGADAATLTLKSTLVGKTITVVVSYQDGNGTQENVSSAAIGPVAALPLAPETPTPPTLPPAPDTPTPPTTPAPDESGGEDGETPTSPPSSPPPSPQPGPDTDSKTDPGTAPDNTGLTGNPNLSGGSGLGNPLPFLAVQTNVLGASPLNLIGNPQTLVQPIRREDVATLLPIPENQLSFSMMTLQTQELSSSRLEEFSLRRLAEEEVNRNVAEVDLTTRTLQIGGLALSTLAAAWAVRMSGIMASLMISMPIWRNIDPLPILHQQNKARRDWLEDLPEEKDFHTRSDAEDIPSQAEGNRI